MAKIRPFGLVMEIIAILAGIAMFVVGYLLFPYGDVPLWQFLLFVAGGGGFILIGMILFIIDVFRMGKESAY